jgi:hypothetical protein
MTGRRRRRRHQGAFVGPSGRRSGSSGEEHGRGFRRRSEDRTRATFSISDWPKGTLAKEARQWLCLSAPGARQSWLTCFGASVRGRARAVRRECCVRRPGGGLTRRRKPVLQRLSTHRGAEPKERSRRASYQQSRRATRAFRQQESRGPLQPSLRLQSCS